MLILMNGSMPTVARYRDRIPFGLLLTPLGGLGVETAFATDLEIGVDNAAFVGFDAARFRRLLARIPDPPPRPGRRLRGEPRPRPGGLPRLPGLDRRRTVAFLYA
jgi:hypothetical protein